MQKKIAFMLMLVLMLSLIGCGKRITQEAVETAEATESLELNPYEKYISTVTEGEYRYVDLDGDGEQELIIYRKNNQSEIITISDGEPVVILSISDMFFCEGNVIGQFSEGSGGMSLFYYQINGQEAVIADVIMRASSDGAWYHSSDSNIPSVTPQNMARITEEDAFDLRGKYALLDASVPWFLTWFYEE